MKTLFTLLLAVLLSACYISKSLDREVHVSIDTNIPVNIMNNGNSNFTGAGDVATYQAKFLEGMKAEFNTSKVIPDGVKPEFHIQITSLNMTETTTIETVNDTTSDDHGSSFELTELDYTASGTLTRLKDNVQYNWSASKDKEEKVKSSRTVIQMATGQNKEQNVYREKELSENEAIDLCWNTGRRSGNDIVKEILRSLK